MFKSIRAGGRAAGGVLLVGQLQGQKLDSQTLEHEQDGRLAAAAGRAEATGKPCTISEAHDVSGFERVLVVGLGEPDKLTADGLRSLAGVWGRRLAAIKATSLTIDLAGPLAESGLDPREAGVAFGEGLGLIGWNFREFRGKASEDEPRTDLKVRSSDKAFDAGLKEGLALAESANLARSLSETPPNICTPRYMAEQAKKLAKETGMTCKVIEGAALEKEKLAGLINVGKASENAPCLIRIEYTPEKPARGATPAVLVGKTITYDSGGLSIKVGGGMRGMKRDKDGGCAVLGAMHAIATVLKPRRPVVALLACAENAISDEAYRPDDILEFANGVTVEVTNTDAEGRLVLADALAWACRKEKPGFIADAATLTGGVVVALGKAFAGMWCDDDELRGRVEAAAAATGERVWRLPHDSQYREMMKSAVADIVNSAPVREAHPIQGAAFLSYFVDEGVPWVHLDIAGTHAVDKDAGPYIAGPTGFGARLLARLAAGS